MHLLLLLLAVAACAVLFRWAEAQKTDGVAPKGPWRASDETMWGI
jgi:hypothetical protein